jgi:pilus assembly protein CpaB
VKLQTLLILIVALALGGVAVWMIAPAVMSSLGATNAENVSVVTAATDIARGGTIQTEMIRVDSIPKQWANPKAIARMEDAVGRVATIPILAGEPVLATKIAAKGAGVGLAAIVPKGMRAFTIQTPTVATGVAGFILPGNKVDVLLTVKELGGGVGAHGGTIILLQNLEIVAVDQRVGTDPSVSEKVGAATKELRSVTLLVTPEQAAKLDLGQNLGTLHLTLRNPEDSVEVNTLHLATIAELGESHPGLLEAVPKPKPAVPPAPAPKRQQPPEEIRTIRGHQEGLVRVFR